MAGKPTDSGDKLRSKPAFIHRLATISGAEFKDPS